jgi:hypothetical protein
MLYLKKEEDYKALTSGIRRELKEAGVTTLSHTQIAELLARALGHKSLAALKATHKDELAVVSMAPAVPADAPKVPETYDGEDKALADDEAHKAYRLFNTDGSLDLANEGTLVTGLRLHALEGTVEDILGSTCNLVAVSREADGSLHADFDGTEVNWDGTETRHDKRNVALWWSENSEAVSEDRCIVVPDGVDRGTNILNEEVFEEYEFPVRTALVDAAYRYIVDKDQVAQALAEMPYEDGFFGDDFYVNAEQLFNGKRKASLLGLTQRATGFCMHVGEFKLLRERLATLQQPPLF